MEDCADDQAYRSLMPSTAARECGRCSCRPRSLLDGHGGHLYGVVQGPPEVVNRRTVTLKACLIPGLIPGQQVMIESSVVSGPFRISQAEYAGDTHGQDWGVSLTCHRPRPPLLSSSTTTETGVQ